MGSVVIAVVEPGSSDLLLVSANKGGNGDGVLVLWRLCELGAP